MTLYAHNVNHNQTNGEMNGYESDLTAGGIYPKIMNHVLSR